MASMIDNIICNKSEDIGLLVPYINMPVYIKGFCWNKKFDGWAIIHYNNKELPSSRNLLFDYRGNTYSAYGFLPSRFTMSTSLTYHNAIYKEQIN